MAAPRLRRCRRRDDRDEAEMRTATGDGEGEQVREGRRVWAAAVPLEEREGRRKGEAVQGRRGGRRKGRAVVGRALRWERFREGDD